jgi:N6-L-threonylcarbamoyladenine synthase
MKILGIETSCDETAAAVIDGQKNKINVLSNIVSSQIDIHKKYGGVVPEVAAREHVLNILPVINEALEKANIKRQAAPKKIKAIAVTTGPGLITSLQVGVETAKVLSYIWQLPICSINHIEGHIYANFIGSRTKANRSEPSKSNIKFPAVILTVSGGHTMLVLMTGHGKYQTISETRDDAAGEAFDKAAKLLGIGYPGGPAIAAEAEKFIKQHSKISNFQTNFKFSPPWRDPDDNKMHKKVAGQISKIKLPRPMINSANFDFSFSGLKTALLYKLKKDKEWQKQIPEYATEFQQAIIDVLISKTIKAAKKFEAKTVMLTGGVSANLELRKQITEAMKIKMPNSEFLIPDLKYTTDNAVMVATAGYFKAQKKDFTPWTKLKTDPNLEL